MQDKKRDVKAHEKEVVKNQKGQKRKVAEMTTQDAANNNGNRKTNPH